MIAIKSANIYESVLVDEISHNGAGVNQKLRVFDKLDFRTAIDFIDYLIVPPQSSVGFHTHSENEEIYFIIEGNGIINVDGYEKPVKSGDAIVNQINGAHGLTNNSTENIRLFIFQVSLKEERSN